VDSVIQPYPAFEQIGPGGALIQKGQGCSSYHSGIKKVVVGGVCSAMDRVVEPKLPMARANEPSKGSEKTRLGICHCSRVCFICCCCIQVSELEDSRHDF